MAIKLSRRKLLGATSSLVGGAALSSIIPATANAQVSKEWMTCLPSADDHIPEYVKMSNNENPWGPSPASQKAMLEAMHESSLYNFTLRRTLVEELSKTFNLPGDHISYSAGSAEILSAVGTMAGRERATVVSPTPTFAVSARVAANLGSKVINIPVRNDDLSIDLDAMRAAVTDDVKLVYLCNPNNPIPSIIEKNRLRKFCIDMSRQAVVLVDEAYFEFVDNPDNESMINLVREGHNNIIVSRTTSKIHGLAAVRMGFAFGHPDMIKKLNFFKTGTPNIFAVHATLAGIKDTKFQDFVRAKNKESLAIVEGMYDELGVNYIKSNANFSYANTGIDPNEIRETIMKHGMRVSGTYKELPTWLRVSMAKPEQMKKFVSAFKREFGHRVVKTA